ncbi:MAG TPA: glycoside hydrolase family 27 protein, partial [Gemmatimonadaceae bacterium]|nr:glycoside hydrolase family 27 protein [Gemmatimonadaceae bacterium]
MRTHTRAALALVPLLLIGAVSLPRALRFPNPRQPGLALTPPMGWNSWNHFGCNVSDSLIRGTADAMVTSGMRDVGYKYVVIDDCWQVSRDSKGTIVADSVRFPHGIKALADYVHSKGLKFGIYTDAGTKTCQGRPGSYGYEDEDARTYASWGVDYVKE